MASVHGVAAIAEAPGEFSLHRHGLLARGHRVEVAIQPGAEVFPVLSDVPGRPVALLVLAQAFRRRDGALADVDAGYPGLRRWPTVSSSSMT